MAAQANADIKAYAIIKGVKLYQLAKHLGFTHENNLSRKLRDELTVEKKEEYKKAIDEIAKSEQ